MKTYTNLQARGVEAAKKFLDRRGYEILDENPRYEAIDLVARVDDTISIVSVATRSGEEIGFPKDNLQRNTLENSTALWLKDHGSELPADIRVRFDSIAILLLSDSKAFLRFHINVLGAE